MFLAAFFLVAVYDQSAGRTDVGAHAQGFGRTLPAARTILTGIGRRHGYDSSPSVGCFGFEDGAELCPAGITDALGQMVIADQVGKLATCKSSREIVAYWRRL